MEKPHENSDDFKTKNRRFLYPVKPWKNLKNCWRPLSSTWGSKTVFTGRWILPCERMSHKFDKMPHLKILQYYSEKYIQLRQHHKQTGHGWGYSIFPNKENVKNLDAVALLITPTSTAWLSNLIANNLNLLDSSLVFSVFSRRLFCKRRCRK